MAGRVRVIGVTGSIGMGKSVVTSQFALLGAKTCSSDAVVHRLLGPNGKAVAAVAEAFPLALSGNRIDRPALGKIVFDDDKLLKLLEKIVHPFVIAEEKSFIRREARKGARLIVLDIPLLYETGAEARLDGVAVATATHLIQRQRVLKRRQMSEEKFASILARQWPDAVKRARADWVIHTGLGRAHSLRQVRRIVRQAGKETADA